MPKNTKSPGVTRTLTPAELEMMQVIWRLGPCRVAQVQEELGKERQLPYTSVSTIVRILEQKRFLSSARVGRGYIYTPTITREDYQTLSVKHLVRNIFDGTPSLLVQHMLDSRAIGSKELARIRALLDKRNKAK